jgi:hypothetical protein
MEGGEGRRLEEDHQANLDRTPSPILERSSSALLDRGKRSLTSLIQPEILKNFRLIQSKSRGRIRKILSTRSCHN